MMYCVAAMRTGKFLMQAYLALITHYKKIYLKNIFYFFLFLSKAFMEYQ